MQVQAQTLGNDPITARFGYITRLKLIPIESVLLVTDPVAEPLPDRPYTVAARGLVVRPGATVTDMQPAFRLGSYTEAQQNDGQSYQLTLVAPFPRPSAQLMAWLDAHQSGRFLAIWQNDGGQVFLAGEPYNGLRLQTSRGQGDKDQLTLSLQGRSWHASWFLEAYENETLFKTRPFSQSFSSSFNS